MGLIRKVIFLGILLDLFISCLNVTAQATDFKLDRQISIELNFIPSDIKPGDKPITLNKDLLSKILPELRSPRRMHFDDLGTLDEQEEFLEGGYAFVLRGDFDRDGMPDIVFVGKYDNENNPSNNCFIAIVSIIGKNVVRKFLSTLTRDRVSLVRVINYKPNVDAIGMSYNLASDDCGYLYWTSEKWKYDGCKSVSPERGGEGRP